MRPDRTASSFIGSINETASGWEHSYEMVWEDRSEAAAEWVQAEFDWLWDRGVPLAQAVIDEIGRTVDKIEVLIEELKDNPLEFARSVLMEGLLARNGERLASWQKEFVRIFIDHGRKYGAARRLLLADEVGVGKILSMASVGALSVLGQGDWLRSKMREIDTATPLLGSGPGVALQTENGVTLYCA